MMHEETHTHTRTHAHTHTLSLSYTQKNLSRKHGPCFGRLASTYCSGTLFFKIISQAESSRRRKKLSTFSFFKTLKHGSARVAVATHFMVSLPPFTGKSRYLGYFNLRL